MPDDDPRSQAYDIYHWLGLLQETLVDALAPPLSRAVAGSSAGRTSRLRRPRC